jgi:hypothetical protein
MAKMRNPLHAASTALIVAVIASQPRYAAPAYPLSAPCSCSTGFASAEWQCTPGCEAGVAGRIAPRSARGVDGALCYCSVQREVSSCGGARPAGAEGEAVLSLRRMVLRGGGCGDQRVLLRTWGRVSNVQGVHDRSMGGTLGLGGGFRGGVEEVLRGGAGG